MGGFEHQWADTSQFHLIRATLASAVAETLLRPTSYAVTRSDSIPSK